MRSDTEKNNAEINFLPIKRSTLFILGCLLGILFFAAIYGLRIVDPTYDDWIMEKNGDVTQHYMGWTAYRSTPWKFPVGLIDGLLSTGDISCIYTDSIPILAVFFKILSPLLPETFQYIGLWELMCYALMGGLSAVLISRFSRNVLFCLAGAVPFIISPTVLARALVHEALSGQWIIIAALILWAWRGKNWKHKASPVILWGLLGVTASLTHIYFIPMIYIVMSGYIICDIFLDRKFLRPALVFTVTTAVSTAALWLFGAFYGDPPMADCGLGDHASNYNVYFNSCGHSRFLSPLASYGESNEGFGYLGLGMLILCAVSAVLLICGVFRRRKSDTFRRHAVIAASAAFMAFASLFLAASPRGAFFDKVIYEIPYPALIEKCLSIFRASGRFIWVSVYIIFTAAIAVIARMKIRKLPLAIICCCAVIQYADLSLWMGSKKDEYFRTLYSHSCPLETEEMNEVLRDKKEFIFVPIREDYLSDRHFAAYFSFGEYAIRHNIKLSCFYVARADYYALEPYASAQLDMLSSGCGRSDAVYVFLEEDALPADSSCIDIYTADGIKFAVTKQKS